MSQFQTAEHQRLADWKRWGERAWGMLREDYSAAGEAWDYFPHDQGRSRAPRWNEDGLAALVVKLFHDCGGE